MTKHHLMTPQEFRYRLEWQEAKRLDAIDPRCVDNIGGWGPWWNYPTHHHIPITHGLKGVRDSEIHWHVNARSTSVPRDIGDWATFISKELNSCRSGFTRLGEYHSSIRKWEKP